MIQHGILAAVLLLFSGLAAARPAAIDDYLDALAQAEQAQQPLSLEPLMTKMEAAQDTLMAIQGMGDQAWMEQLDEAAWKQLQGQLRGFQLSRGYDVYAQPDAAFLLNLAQAHGLPADREFFSLYRGYWSEELLPQYLSIGRRPTPCVRFGEGVLQQQYAGWSGFAKRHPQSYAAFTRQTLADLEEAVSLGVCTCEGNEQDVSRELRSFLKRFPQTPVAAKIRSRIVELKENPSIRPVYCR